MSQYSGKRKLIYSPEREETSFSRKKDTQEKRCSIGSWQSFGEGFSGLAKTEHNNPTAKRQKTVVRQSVTSISGKFSTEVSESIAWSSSDDGDDEYEKGKSGLYFSPKVRETGPRYKASVRQDDMAVSITDDESSSEAWWSQSGIKKKSTQEKVDSQNQGGKNSQVSDVTASIFSYESEGSRHSFSQQETGEHLQNSEVSQDIESMPSQSPAPSQASSSLKVKASDWVKTLNFKTPSKDSQSGDTDILEDSAKKKKKFKSGGLANQLNKVLMRERSSLRIWSHHQQNSRELESQATSSSKIITLEVVSFELLYSLQLARCEVLTGPVESDQILVLFSAATVQQHCIQEGSVVHIHPPWQQLDLKQTNQKVLLCTNYCKVVNSDDLCNPRSLKVTREKSVKVTGKWNCPCVTDLVRNYQSCPAYLLPCIPAVTISRDPSCCDPEDNSERSRLTVIQASHPLRSETKCPVSTTILDSIHRQGAVQEGQGHSFSALVHRVIQKRTQQICRWCVMVEDIQGTICEVLLPKERDSEWDKVLQGEGQSFSFCGLKVHSRTTRERDFRLFTLIDTIWSGVKSSTLSQGSDQEITKQGKHGDESDQAGPCTVEPPGFCYIMKGDNSVGIKVTPIDIPVLQSRYRTLSLVDLARACEKPADLKRFCFVAKVLAVLPSKTQDADMRGDVTTSPHSGHCYVYVWCGVPSSELGYSNIRVVFDVHKTVCGQVMFFKDVFYNRGQLCCDGYSQILPTTAAQNTSCLSTNSEITDAERRVCQGEITIPNISCNLPDLSLCKAVARVTDVDESSAYSWDICNYCGSDQLIMRQSDLICLGCQKAVHEPVSKMNMDVHVVCGGLDIPVTVSLQQDCIEGLLPEETTDEGYDIESVLGKDLGTIFGVLQSRIVHGGKVEKLKLKQINVTL